MATPESEIDPRSGKGWSSYSAKSIYYAKLALEERKQREQAAGAGGLPTADQWYSRVNAPAMSQAALNSQLPPDLLAGLNAYLDAGAPQQEEEPPQEEPWTVDDLLAAFASASGGGGGGGGGVGYNLADVIARIGQAYDTRLAEMDRQRADGESIIGQARAAATAAIDARKADQAGVATGINTNIINQYAQAIDQAIKARDGMSQQMARLGADPSRIRSGADTVNYLQQARDAQSALSQRMQQINDQSIADRAYNMELIGQGASGTLANNYASAKMQMDLMRQQQEAEAEQQYAQAAAAAAARSYSAPSDPLDSALKYLNVADKFNKVFYGDENASGDPAYDLSQLDPSSGAFAAALFGGKGQDTAKFLKDYYTGDVEVWRDSITDEPMYREAFDRESYLAAVNALAKARTYPSSLRVGSNKALSKTTFKSN